MLIELELDGSNGEVLLCCYVAIVCLDDLRINLKNSNKTYIIICLTMLEEGGLLKQGKHNRTRMRMLSCLCG